MSIAFNRYNSAIISFCSNSTQDVAFISKDGVSRLKQLYRRGFNLFFIGKLQVALHAILCHFSGNGVKG